MKNPCVSVCCFTYNHEKFVREALDGFLMQKTNFPFEILIHDDASTDGTADIIREYDAKYPEIIKPIYQTENQYSKGIDIPSTYVFPKAQGKYIALCEGDDCWCDPNKLQIQFDFMENHLDYSYCWHGRYILDEKRKLFYPEFFSRNVSEQGAEVAHSHILGRNLFATQTMFFRKFSYDQKRENIIRDTRNAPMGDFQLAFHLALSGNVKYIRRRMAVYRIQKNSVSHSDKCFADFTIAAGQRLAADNNLNSWWDERLSMEGTMTERIKKFCCRYFIKFPYFLIGFPMFFYRYCCYMKNKRVFKTEGLG